MRILPSTTLPITSSTSSDANADETVNVTTEVEVAVEDTTGIIPTVSNDRSDSAYHPNNTNDFDVNVGHVSALRQRFSQSQTIAIATTSTIATTMSSISRGRQKEVATSHVNNNNRSSRSNSSDEKKQESFQEPPTQYAASGSGTSSKPSPQSSSLNDKVVVEPAITKNVGICNNSQSATAADTNSTTLSPVGTLASTSKSTAIAVDKTRPQAPKTDFDPDIPASIITATSSSFSSSNTSTTNIPIPPLLPTIANSVHDQDTLVLLPMESPTSTEAANSSTSQQLKPIEQTQVLPSVSNNSALPIPSKGVQTNDIVCETIKMANVPAPNNSKSAFCEAVTSIPSILSVILDFLGDPVYVCRIKMVNKSCYAYVDDHEHKLMRNAVRKGGMMMSVRPSFWIWVTLYKGQSSASIPATTRDSEELQHQPQVDMDESERQGREGKWHHVIERDVSRTFGTLPPHKIGTCEDVDFALGSNAITDTMKVKLQFKLSYILHALAAAHPDVGYCQGMNYLVAHLLRILQDTIRRQAIRGILPPIIKSASTALDLQTLTSNDLSEVLAEVDNSLIVEETCFRVMNSFFTSYNLQHFYWPELRCLKTCCGVFEKIVQLKLPVLADHFEHHELNVGLFALGWFQTLFLYLPGMPSATVCHMWDIWLVERSFKIFFRVGTAILFLSQPILLNHELEGMMGYLNTLPDATLLSPDILIACSLQIKITNRMLMELEQEVKDSSMTN